MTAHTLPGTLEMKSANGFIATFTMEDGREQILAATVVPNLPHFTVKNVKIMYSDEEQLTATHGYSGEIGMMHFKISLENGPTIEGEVDQPPASIVPQTTTPTIITNTTAGTLNLDPINGSSAMLTIEDDLRQYFSATITGGGSSRAAANVLKISQISDDGFTINQTYSCTTGALRIKFTLNGGQAGGGQGSFNIVGVGSWLMTRSL